MSRIVISALHFAWRDMAECLGRARDEFGLDGVELSWHESFTRPHCTRDDLSALRSQALPPELSLSAHLWEDAAGLESDIAAARLLAWLEECRGTGVRQFILHGGSYPRQREGLVRLRTVLAGVLPAFEAAGVTLSLENHYAFDYRDGHELLSAPWEFRQLFDLNSHALRFCFDTGHGNMTRNSTALLRELAPWLNYVHLADNRGEHDDHLAYRAGSVDWASVFDTLEEIGFNGTFCIEFPAFEQIEPLRACVSELRRRWPRQ